MHVLADRRCRHPSWRPSRRRRPSRPSRGGRYPPAGARRSSRCRSRAATLSAGPVLSLRGEDGGVRRDHAVAAARPHHRDLRDVGLAAPAVLHQDAAERLVGENAGEIVDAAIAFGLADDGDDLIGRELAGPECRPRGRRRPARSSVQPSRLRSPFLIFPVGILREAGRLSIMQMSCQRPSAAVCAFASAA